MKPTFYETITGELNQFLEQESRKFPDNESLRIDLHCHDCESNKPDEMMGRILNIPETWISTSTLLRVLKENGCTVFTVTNHNNARSCWNLLEKGEDILSGAEFSCNVPDLDSRIHVLAYGFTPDEEVKLRKLRSNVYRFQEYAVSRNIPTVWAHPLFHYHTKGGITLDVFNKLSLVFKYYETMNGQRDTWQNMLVYRWISSLTPEKIEENAKRFGIPATEFQNEPYNKFVTGGSDEHMGIFTGQTGVRLHIPELEERLKNSTRAELALEALREGRIAVFGNHHDSEKMTMAFIDYFCQLGLNLEDPGLLRILFHKGETRDKILALAITNGFLELRRHKLTSTFLDTFHRCMLGENPGFIKKLLVPKSYRGVFDGAVKIAKTSKAEVDKRPLLYRDSVEKMFDELTDLVVDRITENLKKYPVSDNIELSKAIMDFDVPSHVRSLFESGSLNLKSGDSKKKKNKKKKNSLIGDVLDGLPFPLLGSAVLAAATFTSAKVLYNTRPMLDEFAKSIGAFRHPKRALWLTDTFNDGNLSSEIALSYLKEIQKRKLPIDMLICSDEIKPQENLLVIPTKAKIEHKKYLNYPIRVPNIVELHRLFKDREYDRIICSSEGFMGLASLYLKEAYTVPAYFFLLSDWMSYSKSVLGLEKEAQSRVRRILRSFYNQYDGVFAFNSEQLEWLKSRKIGLPQEKAYLLNHWIEPFEVAGSKQKVYNVSDDTRVVLFAPEFKKEHLPDDVKTILKAIKKSEMKIHCALLIPDGVTVSDEQKNKEISCYVTGVEFTEDDFYNAADIIILPHSVDVISLKTHKALLYGKEVISYKSKGKNDFGDLAHLVSSSKDAGTTLHKILSTNEKKNARNKLERLPDKSFELFLHTIGLI
jgi:hypothetical protein